MTQPHDVRKSQFFLQPHKLNDNPELASRIYTFNHVVSGEIHLFYPISLDLFRP